MLESCSVFHIEQKIEFEKFNCFFIDFLRYSFGRIKVISTVVERECTPDITWQFSFAYQLSSFYMIRGFTERYFLTGYSYILENHFYFINAPDYRFLVHIGTIYFSMIFVSDRRTLSTVKHNDTIRYACFFFYVGFLSQPFTNHRTAEERGRAFLQLLTTTSTCFPDT